MVRLLAPNFFWQAAAPIFRLADTVAETNHAFFASFSDATALVVRNEQLVKENAALENENQSLRKKEAITGGFDSSKGILAAVVARPPESPYDTLVLAAGSIAGVALGQEAFGVGKCSARHRHGGYDGLRSRHALFCTRHADIRVGWERECAA